MIEYGCHVDLLPGDRPEGCVLDSGRAVDCLVAQSLKASGLGKSECMHWRPIADCASELSSAYALIYEMYGALVSVTAYAERIGAQDAREIVAADALIERADAFLAERTK